jgi:hypothetical protein|tara:strand:- start:1279 stop:2199 length:921 start_codon:yes stop_codon:yes gene_type:complete
MYKHEFKKLVKHNIKRHHNKKTKKLKKVTCNPSSKKSFTCYNDKSLHTLKNLWNQRHPDDKIVTTYERDIWEELKNKMSDVCNNEQCWLKQKFVEHKLTPELTTYTFAPKAPKIWIKNPREWLNSSDINNVMKQYENEYSDFEFIGPSPIDFDSNDNGTCVWPDICNFKLSDKIRDNKKKIGFIFNTDPHYKSGSHWFTIFFDIKNKFIFFFNSTGEGPVKEINILMDRIMKQSENMGVKIKKIINKQVHQQKNTECGMYSLYCISELVCENKTPEHFITERISDKQMEDLRYKFFSNPNLDDEVE